jgi:hypothetical protein
MIILKRKTKLITYEVHRTMPSVYTVVVPDQYERAMLFVRYQEFYESPYKEFYNKKFHLVDFMNHYRKDRGSDYFSYPKDWSGYNIPSDALLKCVLSVPDSNLYDKEMTDIVMAIASDLQKIWYDRTKRHKFYIIGVDSIESRVMDHEIAHSLFYTSKEYKKKMTFLVNNLNPKKREKLTDYLLKIGYRKQMIVDEIQAFMSTGLTGEMEKIVGPKERAAFVWEFDSAKEQASKSKMLVI